MTQIMEDENTFKQINTSKFIFAVFQDTKTKKGKYLEYSYSCKVPVVKSVDELQIKIVFNN